MAYKRTHIDPFRDHGTPAPARTGSDQGYSVSGHPSKPAPNENAEQETPTPQCRTNPKKQTRERPKVLDEDFVREVKDPGRYGDGRGGYGLSLLVKPTKIEGQLSKTWSQRVRIDGRETNLGFGNYPAVTLTAARRRALQSYQAIKAGRDPRIDGAPTFSEATAKVLERRAKGLGPKCNSPAEWEASFRIHVYPFIGHKEIGTITRLDIMACLEPIWFEKRVTATKLLHRIRKVMRWAIAHGYRENDPTEYVRDGLGSNPAKTKHRDSVAPDEARPAIKVIEESRSNWAVKGAMTFLIFTVGRSLEVRGATWDEIDLDKAIWTIPADRRKTRKQFRVPLSGAAMAVLEVARKRTDGVAPGVPLTPKRRKDDLWPGSQACPKSQRDPLYTPRISQYLACLGKGSEGARCHGDGCAGTRREGGGTGVSA